MSTLRPRASVGFRRVASASSASVWSACCASARPAAAGPPPAGSSSGRKVRLKGRGFPDKSGANGDLLGEIRIMVPKSLSERDRELFEKLATDSTFNPREHIKGS